MSNLYSANTYSQRDGDQKYADLESFIRDAQIDRELSAERNYNLKDLTVVPAGDRNLALASGRGAAGFTHWSFGQFCRMIGAPASYLRDDLSPQLAADCANYGIQKSGVGASANLFVRGQNGLPPIVRAVTGKRYDRVFDAEFISAANDQIFAGGRSKGTGHEWHAPTAWSGEKFAASRSDRDSFVIQIDGGSIVTDPSAGQSGQMYRGILLRNSEVGASSVTIECVLFRYICGNFILWGASIDRKFKRRHVGTDTLRAVLRELGQISYEWTHRPASADEAMIRRLIDRELATTEAGIVDELRALGATEEQAKNAYAKTVATETGNPRSFWTISQGITRISQDSKFQDERHELDALAGRVLARGAKLVAV